MHVDMIEMTKLKGEANLCNHMQILPYLITIKM